MARIGKSLSSQPFHSSGDLARFYSVPILFPHLVSCFLSHTKTQWLSPNYTSPGSYQHPMYSVVVNRHKIHEVGILVSSYAGTVKASAPHFSHFGAQLFSILECFSEAFPKKGETMECFECVYGRVYGVLHMTLTIC